VCLLEISIRGSHGIEFLILADDGRTLIGRGVPETSVSNDHAVGDLDYAASPLGNLEHVCALLAGERTRDSCVVLGGSEDRDDNNSTPNNQCLKVRDSACVVSVIIAEPRSPANESKKRLYNKPKK
jgi:hypothetical protein